MSPRRIPARRIQRTFSVLALFALLQTAVGVIAFPEIAGWQPDHGHIYSGQFAPDHSHPYDHQNEHGAATSLFGTEAPPTDSSESQAIVFTPSQDGSAGPGSVTLLAILGPRLLPAAGGGTESLAARGERAAPPDAHVPVTTPPPRI